MTRWRGWLLALGLLAAPAAAAEPWREASSAHFVIYSQEDEADLRRFAERLERFDKAMRLLRSLPDEPMGAANRLTVYVVRDVGQVQRLLGTGPRNVAGFYQGRAGGSVAFTPRIGGAGGLELNAQIVLLHEYAHHFMARYFPAAYPAWFVEGFAEFNSTARFEKDGGIGIGLPAVHRAYELFAGGDALPLADLVGDTRAKLTDAQRATLYSRGWLLTHYLTFAPARKGQLSRYLDAINEGIAPARAAVDAFGPIRQLDRELRAYVSRPMRYVPLAANELPVAPVAIRLLAPAEQAMLPIAMRSQRGVDGTTAPPLAVEARKVAAAFPANAFVQAALAEAEHDAGNLDDAEAAADRAVAADARSMRGLLYKAMIQLARAGKASGEARRALVKAARTTATRANRVDPDDPRPLALFYTTYPLLGEAPTANAVMGLTVAHQLAPEDEGLRMMLAQQFLHDRQADKVRGLLKPIVNDPHGDARDAARAMLAALPAAETTAQTAPAKP